MQSLKQEFRNMNFFGSAILKLSAVTAMIGMMSSPAFSKDDKTKKVESKPAEAAVSTLKASGGLKWTGYGVGKSHTGDLALKSGTIQMKGTELTGGEFIIDMNSLSYKNKRLEGHLKSADFFEVTKPGFETAVFKITKVEALKPAKPTDPTHKISGDLTIKGKTNPIDFMAVVSQDGKKWKAVGDAEIKDRTTFDIRYNSTKFATVAQLADKAIEDRITINISVVAE